MYNLYGEKACIEFLYRFSSALQKRHLGSLSEMRSIYLTHFLPGSLQPIASARALAVPFELVRDGWGLSSNEGFLSASNFKPNTSFSVELESLQRLMDSFDYEDPDYWQIFSLYVPFVTIDSNIHCNSGTRSSRLGIIVVNQRREFDYSDFSEMCVHELCHTMLFVNEFVRPYCDSGDAETVLVQSAIRQRKRPLRPAFHSVVVNAEVLLYRHKKNMLHITNKVHGSTASLVEKLGLSLSDFESRPHILNDYGHGIIAHIRKTLSDVGIMINKTWEAA